VAGVGAKAVLEFLPFEILRLFRIEFGRDGRGLGARRITGSVSADAPARTATPPMSAMSVMFFIYGCNFWFLHAYNSRLSGPCIWDQSPTPRRIGVEKLAVASAGLMILRRLKEVFPEKKSASRGTRGRFPR